LPLHPYHLPDRLWRIGTAFAVLTIVRPCAVFDLLLSRNSLFQARHGIDTPIVARMLLNSSRGIGKRDSEKIDSARNGSEIRTSRVIDFPPVTDRDFRSALCHQLAKFLESQPGLSATAAHRDRDTLFHRVTVVVLVEKHFEIPFRNDHGLLSPNW
jgi:hypothetical protein